MSVTALPMPGAIFGVPARTYAATAAQALLGRSVHDLRHAGATTGVVADRVMYKASASAPELPFASGRVWLLRLADGYRAWEGFSDAQGNYRATGLELGVVYVAVAIDPWGNHKTVGASPVVARAEP